MLFYYPYNNKFRIPIASSKRLLRALIDKSFKSYLKE